MGEASVQVIARFGDSVLHIWTGAPRASVDVTTLTNGLAESDAKPFWLQGERLVVFGAPLALGDRSLHVIDGLRLEISYDAPTAPAPRKRVLGKAVFGIALSGLAHAAFATSIATSEPDTSSSDRADALSRLEAASPAPTTPRRVRWASDLAVSPSSPSPSPSPSLSSSSPPSDPLESPAARVAPKLPAVRPAERPLPRSLPGVGDHTSGAPPRAGKLDPALIQRAVNTSRGRFAMCVQTAHAVDPTIAGRVAVSFGIDPEGRVTNAVVTEAPTGAPGLAACVRSAFEGLTFAKPEGGPVRVTYPFVVSPSSTSPG